MQRRLKNVQHNRTNADETHNTMMKNPWHVSKNMSSLSPSNQRKGKRFQYLPVKRKHKEHQLPVNNEKSNGQSSEQGGSFDFCVNVSKENLS